MRLAITLSAFGLGTTSPNPPVGCVILDASSQVVGLGFHRRKGEPHAEANALADAGDQAQGGTALVTLEPCNHFGVTPPCHQALIDAGIERVLIAVMDPTSRGEGGAARLRQAGIDVEIGVLEEEARLVLGPWLDAQATQRPHIIWPYVISADGSFGSLVAVPNVADLRRTADVVLSADGSITEAVPGSHLPGVLNLSDLPSNLTPTATVRQLYDAGIRLVLLDATLDQAAPFLDAGLVHQMLAYWPGAEINLKTEPRPEILLQNFHFSSVQRVNGCLCVESELTATADREVLDSKMELPSC